MIKRKIKNRHYFFLKIFILINIFILTYSCHIHNSKEKKKNYKSSISSKKQTNIGRRPLKNKPECKKCGNEKIKDISLLIVYIHGLTTNSEVCSTTKSFHCMKNFIDPKCEKEKVYSYILTLGRTLDLSIFDQAKRAHIKLQNFFKNRNIRKDTKIIFVCHSAGGLVGSHLAIKYSDSYNIVGMITISCPWSGINIISEEHVTPFAKLILKKFKTTYQVKRKGIIDLLRHSKYLRWIKKNIHKIKVPVLVIGGKTKFYKQIFNMKNIKKHIFKKHADEKLFFGTIEHDGVVPLESQLGEKIGFPKNFQRVILKNYVNHSSGLIERLENSLEKFSKLIRLSVEEKLIMLKRKKQVSILDCLETVNHVLGFVQRYHGKPIS